MPDDTVPSYAYLKMAIGFAAIAFAVLAFVVWWQHPNDGKLDVSKVSSPATDEQKLRVMQQLSASAATSVPNVVKEKALTQLRASSELEAPKAAKAKVMQSLQAY
jgi:hypothetical protein